MKKLIMATFVATAFLATSCSDDDISDPLNPIGDSKTYELHSVSDPAVTGTATFNRNEDNTTTIKLELEGASGSEMHPAHIHFNSAVETGDIAITLNAVGENGTSVTDVSELDDGTAITYTDLMEFDGYLNVHMNAENLDVLLAQADIGGNELTGESKTYDLHEVDVPGVTGTATFEKRKNGTTLATLQVEPTNDDDMHPAHIHANTAVETGAIVLTFNPIDGATGKSYTNIETLDDETSISYDDLMNFDGYLNVHLSANDLGTLVAQSDIGQNELTGETETYALDPVSNPNISGNAVFAARANGETLVTITLEGTVDGDTHPAHIHSGSVAEPGDIAITLNNVDGETGISATNVSELDADGAINYDALIEYDGYLNVHLSPIDLDILVAQGNIGANVE
ncbi:MAG TPA: CHRD domain-containing protein [Flavobacteriaceae bacterium]|nr:CHRD domain-containing protein [Flavobacteriaceae bacterium]